MGDTTLAKAYVKRSCYQCGLPLKMSVRFCPSCKADQALASYYKEQSQGEVGFAEETCANGHALKAGSRFCTICGEPEVNVPENERSCPACGAEAVPCSSFCVLCGHSLAGFDPLSISRDANRKKRDDAVALGETSGKKTVIPPTFIADELAKLGALRDSGLLTEEEFAQQKMRLLNS